MERRIETKQIPWERAWRYDGAVIGLIVVVLIAALGLKAWVEGQASVSTDLDARLSLRYPASWAAQDEKGTLLSIRDLQSKGSVKVTFSVAATELDPAAIPPLQKLAEVRSRARAEDLTNYRELDITDTKMDGLEAVQTTYAYVADPRGGFQAASLPVVVQGVDILVVQGSSLYVFTFAAPASGFAEAQATLDAILESVAFEREP